MIDPAPTYVVPASYPAARLAVAGALAVLEEVRSGKADAGLALVRPPGHHALADQAMGFCLMNNVAILTRAAQSFGWGRVMIVDFDVHHGNGTQAIFEGDPDVLFVSTHQSGIYPGTGDWTETGIGAAAGCTVNIPLPAGAGDVAFESIASRLLRPLCQRHRPNLLLVSAGFDAHWRDPLAGLQVSLRGYYELSLRLVEMAREFTDGRLVFVTEGGYDPTVMTEGVSAVIAALLELPSFADRLGPAPGPEPTIGEEISRIAALHGI
jgi:acetoin utilization deacetylase AcuC-like enzyme